MLVFEMALSPSSAFVFPASSRTPAQRTEANFTLVAFIVALLRVNMAPTHPPPLVGKPCRQILHFMKAWGKQDDGRIDDPRPARPARLCAGRQPRNHPLASRRLSRPPDPLHQRFCGRRAG